MKEIHEKNFTDQTQDFMQIKQFENKNLSHYSYAILSESKIILIDPSRDPKPYLDYAEENNASIIGVIETHPHADFISSHSEFHQSIGATIYTSRLVAAGYPHDPFDEGDIVEFGKIKLSALNTPGHSPDSITIVMQHDGKQKAVFSGDTLFIGDCGRPDLREGTGNIQSTRETLAKQMYHSLRDKFSQLPDDVIVYPAHGAGTLCGKNLSKENSSTIGKEKATNWSLQKMSEEEFVKTLLADQPFVPHYFPFDVELNRKGAMGLHESISRVDIETAMDQNAFQQLDKTLWVIDPRKEKDFKNGHLPHSINLMENGKFETWLGSIIKPNEKFYLTGENKEQLKRMLVRIADIGYENGIEKAFIIKGAMVEDVKLDVSHFNTYTKNYNIVDVRNTSEVKEGKIFANSLSIPLAELRNRISEIPTDKPIVVHCAGGYRSAAASSMLTSALGSNTHVFDLGEAITEFKKK